MIERVTWLLEGITSGAPAIFSSLLFVAFGLATAWLLGLRIRLLLLVAALPTGIGMLLLVAQVLGWAGVHSPLWVDALIVLGAAALIGTARTRMQRSRVTPPPPESPGRLVWAGATVGALIALGIWLAGIGDFRLPPQGPDDIWHGYVIERITHMPTITAGEMVPRFSDTPTPTRFYPYGFHLAGALIHQVTGASIPEVLNGAWVVFVGLALPFGVAALAWRVFPDRPWVTFWSGALASSVTAFPYLANGILPYTLTMAMTPGLLALLLAFIASSRLVPATVLAVVSIGLFATHPAAALVTAVFAAVAVIERLLRLPGHDVVAAARRLGTAAALAAIAAAPLLVVTATDVQRLVPGESVGGGAPALSMFLTLASPWTPAQPVLALLTWIGVATTIRIRRALWISVGMLIFGALFVVIVTPITSLMPLTVAWHGNWFRLLAAAALVVPLLAGLGFVSVVDTALALLRRAGQAPKPRAVALVVVLIASALSAAAAYDSARGQSIVRTAWHVGFVTAHDFQLLQILADRVSPADKVLNSPTDGSTWMYAKFGVHPVLPHQFVEPSLSLHDIYAGNPPYGNETADCRAVAEIGATYAVVKSVRGRGNTETYYDLRGFVSRNPTLFTLLLGTDAGAIYEVNRQTIAQCATH